MKKKIALVTGCAGFIGSNLIHHLLKKKFFVIGVDNFRTGRIEFIKKYLKNKNFIFEKKNLIKDIDLKKIFKNKIDIVFHMAANADVRNGYLELANKYPEYAKARAKTKIETKKWIQRNQGHFMAV